MHIVEELWRAVNNTIEEVEASDPYIFFLLT